MKISFKQFGDLSHSWAQVSTSIARIYKQENHDVNYCSTTGYEHFPEDLIDIAKCNECTDDKTRQPLRCKLDRDHDLSLAYTIPLNWQHYLSYGKRKFAIYNYDGTVLIPGWGKHHVFADLVLPSSEFSKKTFLDAGIPKEKLVIVPHGYDDEFINRKEKLEIKTDKKYKVLVNIQQPHHRKNIIGLLEAWYKTFNKNDDICLVAKVKLNKKGSNEVSVVDEMARLNKKYKNHAEIILLDKFLPFISDLYRGIDIVFSLSHVECFLLPALQALVSEKINICSNWGGNVDFCNESNSLMVGGKVARADPKMVYWGYSSMGAAFYPDLNDACEKLYKAYKEHDQLKAKFADGFKFIKENYSWKNAAKQIMDLY